MTDGYRGKVKFDSETKTMVPVEVQKPAEVHAVIQDTIPPTEYMGNGNREMYESRSQLIRRTEADGFKVTGHFEAKLKEPWKPDPVEIRQHMKQACNDAKYGNVYQTEREKQVCLDEERKYQRYAKRRRMKGY